MVVSKGSISNDILPLQYAVYFTPTSYTKYTNIDVKPVYKLSSLSNSGFFYLSEDNRYKFFNNVSY